MANLIAWMLLLSVMMGTVRADGCRAANVSAGARFTCADLTDGSARCWGDASNGQLGRPNSTTTSDPSGPPLDFGASRTVLQTAANINSTCALLDDHTVSCWGADDQGQLGLGDTQDRDQPTHLQLGTGNHTVQQLSTGSTAAHTCAAVKGEGVFCWGSAGELQGTPWLGKPSTKGINGAQVTLPSKVDLGSNSSTLTVIDMCAGSSQTAEGAHTCILTTQLGLKCWGLAASGQLGLGSITNTTGLTGQTLPPVDLGSRRSAVQVACGGKHTCAVLDNGALKCFGDNTYGQLGYGDTVSRGLTNIDMGDNLKPVDVGQGRTVKQVRAGFTHTCALLDNGQVKCWGDNVSGELGHHCSSSAWGDSPGQMGDSLPAVDLGPGRSAVSTTAGFLHSCAVLDDGSIRCWGRNEDAELGFQSNSSNVCPPTQAVDLGGNCTTNNVGLNGTGPGNHTNASPTVPTALGTPHNESLAPSPSPFPSTSPSMQVSGSPSPPTSPPSPSPAASSSSQSAPAGIIAGAVIAAVVAAASTLIMTGW